MLHHNNVQISAFFLFMSLVFGQVQTFVVCKHHGQKPPYLSDGQRLGARQWGQWVLCIRGNFFPLYFFLSHNLARMLGHHRWLHNTTLILFSAALPIVELAKFISAHLTLSSHFSFCLPLLFSPQIYFSFVRAQNRRFFQGLHKQLPLSQRWSGLCSPWENPLGFWAWDHSLPIHFLTTLLVTIFDDSYEPINTNSQLSKSQSKLEMFKKMMSLPSPPFPP